MPTTDYPIGLKVYDGAGNALSGVSINLINTTTYEELPADYYGLTNSVGEGIVNGDDLPSDYTIGDNYEIVLSKSNYEEYRITGTFSVSGPETFTVDLMREGTKITHFENQSLELNLVKKKVTFKVWANNKASSGTAFVITSGGAGFGRGYTKSGCPVINLYPKQVAYITQISMQIRTAAKVNSVEVVKCSSKDGTGTAVSVSPQLYGANGTLVEAKPYTLKFNSPIRIEYNASSAKSIGLKVTGTDTSTYVDVSMEGYLLEE